MNRMKGKTIFSFAIGRLRDLLFKEGLYLQALAGPAEKLQEMLRQMEDLLEYSEVRQDKRVVEIVELADCLLDSIETYIIQVLSRRWIGIKERLMRPIVHLAIEKVTTKIHDFVNSRSIEELNFGDTSYESRRIYKVQDLSCFNEKDFVGRKEDINKLVSYLVDQQDEHFGVISIYGMGGLGKTTLAQKVYKDPKVLSHFQRFAFVCVSEQCQAEDILKHILQQLVPEENEAIKGLRDGDIIEWLQRVQREKRCLVIIDDIWSIPDWESLSHGLPSSDGCIGSKILLTTRIKDVAEMGFCYVLNSLSKDECWELFRKTIFMRQDSQADQQREELGRKMIEWCHGVPLAVLVLRGVLVTKGSLREWLRFYESRKWGGKAYEQFNGEVVEELLFSYKELPYPLKPCFLYMGNFVADEEIDAEMLYMLWDAEGMILSQVREAGETMIDVAERYLGELVGRSMVEAKLVDEEVHPTSQRKIKSCRLHDLMKQLCLSLIKKENFLMVNDYRGHGDKVTVLNSTSLRNGIKMPIRQALHFSWNQDFTVHDKMEATRCVRSVIFKNGLARKLSNLKKLHLLRVLSLNYTSIRKEDFTDKLNHLRYLSLNFCSIRELPSSIENLIYLQSLDIRTYFDDVLIPNLALRKLKRLRHLFLPAVYIYKVTPKHSRLRLDGLTELETLVNLDSTKCEMKDVIELTSLRRLEGRIHISSEHDGEELRKIFNTVHLDPRRQSSLAVVVDNPKIEIYSDILKGQQPIYCEGIMCELRIIGLRDKISTEFSCFVWLKILILEDFEVEEDPMPTLEKLPNLQNLTIWLGKLKEKELACSKIGFPKLTYLDFRKMENWEKWRMEEGAMPNLLYLLIMECNKLEMLPDELKFIKTLVYLQLNAMSEGFTRRLTRRVGDKEEDGTDFYKIQHVRKVVIRNISDEFVIFN